MKLGNHLFELGLPVSRLLALGAELGSDVPLFLLGGTVLGLDRGDRVFPLRPIPLEPVLLVHPGLYVATPSVFNSIARVGYPLPAPCPSLAEGLAPPWRNDLTGAAIWACPALADVRAALLDSGGDPLLCGSGSCWARDRLAAAHPGWRLWNAGP